MAFNDEKLKKALVQGIITEEIYNKLIEFDPDDNKVETADVSGMSRFSKLNAEGIMLYVGSFIIVIAMCFFMGQIVHKTSYITILLTSIAYFVAFLLSGEYMWKTQNKIPAGIFYLFSILSFAFCVVVVTKMTGFYPKFSELSIFVDSFWEKQKAALTLITVLSLCFSGFLMKVRTNILSIIPLIAGGFFLCNLYCITDKFFNDPLNQYSLLLLLFSILLIGAAVLIDKKTKIDHPLWLYSIGAVMLYLSISLFLSNIDFTLSNSFLIYFICMLVVSQFFFLFALILRRKMFLTLGLLGSVCWFVAIELYILSNAKMPPLFVTSIMIITGILILLLGLKLKNTMPKLEDFTVKHLPKFIQNFINKN